VHKLVLIRGGKQVAPEATSEGTKQDRMVKRAGQTMEQVVKTATTGKCETVLGTITGGNARREAKEKNADGRMAPLEQETAGEYRI